MTASNNSSRPVVAVLGAGPAGLYAANKLVQEGADVLLINRDVKPGGLAEYGIYFDKHKMKNGLRKQFTRILDQENIEYMGHIEVREQDGTLTLDELEKLGCAAYLIAVGAQGTRKLGYQGEDEIEGIFHAKDLVYHYNQLPPFASQDFAVGQHVGIIGMGNVMVDIAHWLVWEKKVASVTVLARRGPAERAYTDKEMREVVNAVDFDALDKEVNRVAPILESIGQDVAAVKEELRKPLDKAETFDSPTKMFFRYLVSVKKLIPDENGRLKGVEVIHNQMVPRGDTYSPKPTEETEVIPLDTLVYAIGDQVDEGLGLPFEWGKYLTPSGNNPHDPEKPRYEVKEAQADQPRSGWFLGGWARVASDGLVGKARADGESAALEVMRWVKENNAQSPDLPTCKKKLCEMLSEKGHAFVEYADVVKLQDIEQARAKEQGVPLFKFNTNEEMFEAIRKA
ncbi:MAG: FAD-dependent oxidoreductase [Myxococcales bacterium]|nr:FAD-dependent oxidoreductase [Myxococcales bacterium]MCB9641980.1 FAD-dependent oxidoreductase [Myxococcales bacterium]